MRGTTPIVILIENPLPEEFHGAKVVTHARYVIFPMAEVAVPKTLFRAILARIRRLRMPETVPG